MKTPEILQALQPVAALWEELSIPYYIGGSIASSIYGIARATMDVDMVADIQSEQIPVIQRRLEGAYYVDETMMREAVRNRSCFNLIHLATMIKIDVFFPKADSYAKQALQRKRKDTLVDSADALEFYVSSAEDILISKLQWYELGGRTSERQWLDVLGILKVQNTNLDKMYLKQWCGKLGVLSLLESACRDSGTDLA